MISAWKAFYQEILRSPKYLSLSVGIAAIVFVFTVWLPNIGLIRDVVLSPDFMPVQKISFLWNSLGAISTNFSFGTAALTVVISILFGLNLALTIYYFRRRLAFQKSSGLSVVGMLAGIIGIGCASCGSVVLATLLGVGATASVTAALPFGGSEFGILGIVILLITMYVTSKKLADPLICGIKIKS